MRTEYSPDTQTIVRPSRSAARYVALRVDPSRMRRAHQEIATRLVAKGARVTFVRGEVQERLPPALDLLLELERIIYRLRDPRPSDRSPWDGRIPRMADGRPDLIVDLCGSESGPAGCRTIRPLYDGVAGEAAPIGALAAGRMPVIDIEDVEAGVVVARAAPCADNAATVSGALDCVLARLVTLVTAIAGGAEPPAPIARSAARPTRLRDVAAFPAERLAWSLVRRLYHLCCHAPHWRTCWRRIDGPDLWDTRSLAGTSWNVLPDPGFRCYADPFPFLHDGRMHLFIEDFDHRSGKAVISLVPFDE